MLDAENVNCKQFESLAKHLKKYNLELEKVGTVYNVQKKTLHFWLQTMGFDLNMEYLYIFLFATAILFINKHPFQHIRPATWWLKMF